MSQSPSHGGGRNEERAPGTVGELGRYAGFGLTIGAATALFAWLGTLLDRWLGTAPAFVLAGAFLGFAAGFYSMYWRLVLQERDASAGAGKKTGEKGARGSRGDDGGPEAPGP